MVYSCFFGERALGHFRDIFPSQPCHKAHLDERQLSELILEAHGKERLEYFNAPQR